VYGREGLLKLEERIYIYSQRGILSMGSSKKGSKTKRRGVDTVEIDDGKGYRGRGD
jgi:hypothetical protein